LKSSRQQGNFQRLKITEALVAEHAAFRAVFLEMERLTPRAGSLQEVRLLASLMEGFLRRHAAKEEDFLYAPYDHVLEHQGQLQRMSQEHAEIDDSLLQVQHATTLAKATNLLTLALSKAEQHFRFEELKVFPAVEEALPHLTLEQLARGA
jgi:hemerythrin-like domain-containing protein